MPSFHDCVLNVSPLSPPDHPIGNAGKQHATMTLTREQRAEVSRTNGRKSKGPVTDGGKKKVSMNAITHGLRAKALSLPGEDPAVAGARADPRLAYYRPASPAAFHLNNEGVRLLLLADHGESAYV